MDTFELSDDKVNMPSDRVLKKKTSFCLTRKYSSAISKGIPRRTLTTLSSLCTWSPAKPLTFTTVGKEE